MRTSIDPDVRTRTDTKEPGTHTVAQDAPPAFLSLKTLSISNLGDELALQFMFYEPRIQEPEPVVPKIWQDFGNRPASSHKLFRHVSPMQSRRLEYSSSQRRSCSTELPSIPADASSSYFGELSLMASRARPSSRLESSSDREVTSITPGPTTPDKPPPPPPHSPAESSSLDHAFLSQPVPTKYLPVNAQLPTRMTWLDVLSLAQSVLASHEEEEPVIQSEVNLLTVAEVDDGDPAADGHSLLAKSHVAEVEQCEDEDEDQETVSYIRSSFDIRDMNLFFHDEVSRMWSWRSGRGDGGCQEEGKLERSWGI